MSLTLSLTAIGTGLATLFVLLCFMKDKTENTKGEFVSGLLIKYGLSWDELSLLSGVSVSVIGEFIRGSRYRARKPNARCRKTNSFARIIASFGLTPNDVLNSGSD